MYITYDIIPFLQFYFKQSNWIILKKKSKIFVVVIKLAFTYFPFQFCAPIHLHELSPYRDDSTCGYYNNYICH